MKRVLGPLAIFLAGLAIFFVLKSEFALLTHPKGVIAHEEIKLIAIDYLLMLIVVIPTFIALFFVVIRNRAKNDKALNEPERKHKPSHEIIFRGLHIA